jgi:hypothetical protein
VSEQATRIKALVQKQRDLCQEAKDLGLTFPLIWMEYSVKTLQFAQEDLQRPKPTPEE